MKVTYCNESQTFGGQEVYLLQINEWIRKQSLLTCSDFRGGPLALRDPLTWSGMGQKTSPANRRAFVVLNGNRALYEHAWRLPSGAVSVYVQHSSIDDAQAGWLRPLIRRHLLRWLLRRVDAVIRVSQACLPDAYAPGKIHTVPNGVDLERFPCRTTWRSAQDRTPFRVLMVGALTPNKNQRLAIEALVGLPDAVLTLVGDGPEREALESLARRLGVSERVRWMGQQADPSPFYREADVCLLLSQHEAAPFVLLESMASGTPVVATPVGGVPEVLMDGQHGVLLADARADVLISVLRQLTSDPGRVRELGLAARDHIEAHYTVDHMVRGFWAVVQEAMQRKQAERHS